MIPEGYIVSLLRLFQMPNRNPFPRLRSFDEWFEAQLRLNCFARARVYERDCSARFPVDYMDPDLYVFFHRPPLKPLSKLRSPHLLKHNEAAIELQIGPSLIYKQE